MKRTEPITIGLLAVTLFTVVLVNCGVIGPVVKTVRNVADVLCEVVAQDNVDELDGMTPEEWCSIKENVDPFLDIVAVAKSNAEDVSGFSRVEESEPTDAGPTP